MNPQRGIFQEFKDDVAVVMFNNHPLELKTANCREYVDEVYLEGPLDSERLSQLAKLAIAQTVDILDPKDPDTMWGFATADSPHFNGKYDE